jgi:glycosyltransferase involved in cell wall biosynthesis
MSTESTDQHGEISVLHVSQATRYGLERFLIDLIADQCRRGWEVTLVSPYHAVLVDACTSAGAHYRRWDARRSPGPTTIAEVLALRGIVKDSRADVIHLHSSKAGFAGRIAIHGRRPTIFSPHAWSFLHEGALMQRASLAWERWASRWTDLTLCCSSSEQQRGEDARIPGRYRVVPNAVDLAHFSSARPGDRVEARDQLGLNRAPLAVCVGRITPQKGQDVLIAAWAEVRRAVPNASLLLVGDDDKGGWIAQPPPAGVEIVGRQDDVRPWLLASDLVVQPSRWEGMSLVVLEALASGRSVVATDVDGMREVIGWPSTEAAGTIVPVEDPRALAAAIIERLGSAALASKEEARARQRATAFSLPVWGERLAALTAEIAGQRVASR